MARWVSVSKTSLLIWISSVLIVSLLTSLATLYRPMCEKYEYTDIELQYYTNKLYREYNFYLHPLSNQEYKSKVDDLLTATDYDYYEVELNWLHVSGFSATFFNAILVDDDLEHFNYCKILTHEILHYKTSSSDERYVEYLTFKVLYESDDIDLHNVGVELGIHKLEQETKNKYWCKDLIINYLRKEKRS